jgi:hypothetical protein
MQGLIHTCDIYRRVTSAGQRTWETTPFIQSYRCRVDSISPSAILREQYASCTHSAVGTYNSDLAQGMRMVVTGSGWCAGKTFSISGVTHRDAGTPTGHHCELMLTEAKL